MINIKCVKPLSIIFIFIFALIGCANNPSLTTKTNSTQFSNKQEKLSFLNKYFKNYGEITDAEYYINYFDNSQGMFAAPSDFDIRVAIKVPQDSFDKWLEGYDEVTENEVKLSWWNKIMPKTEEWETASKPKFYQRDKHFAYLVLYRNEGIILKADTTMMYLEK